MKERIYFRVGDDGRPRFADASQLAAFGARMYKPGTILAAELKIPRNRKFNGLMHALGRLVCENVDGFEGLTPHAAIKRLQLEGGIYCDEVGISLSCAWAQFSEALLRIEGVGSIEPALRVIGSMLPKKAMFFIRQPRSLSFASMDEAEFKDAAKQICRFLADTYWPQCTAEEIERMAECAPNE